MSQTPPDWYPDPSDPASVRYWDGTAWTALTRPLAAAPPASPPAGPPAMSGHVSAPRRSHRGLWITLSAVGVLVVGLGVVGVLFVAGKFAPISSDYTGAPVTRSDVASPGHRSVVSTPETVAAEIPLGWHDVQEYVDIQSAVGELPPGATLLGAWFTGAPAEATLIPQMVIVMEMTPTASGPGTLGDIQQQYLAGMRGSLPNLGFGPTRAYTTALGLEGERTDATFDIAEEALSGTIAVVTVAHGRRFVVVQWTAYDEPIDEESLDAFMAALRVDS